MKTPSTPSADEEPLIKRIARLTTQLAKERGVPEVVVAAASYASLMIVIGKFTMQQAEEFMDLHEGFPNLSNADNPDTTGMDLGTTGVQDGVIPGTEQVPGTAQTFNPDLGGADIVEFDARGTNRSGRQSGR